MEGVQYYSGNYKGYEMDNLENILILKGRGHNNKITSMPENILISVDLKGPYHDQISFHMLKYSFC